MTAIGGFVDWTNRGDCRPDCISILQAQAAYFTEPPSVRSAQWGSFGVGLRPSLPEDRFDRQPIEGRSVHLVADIRLDNRDDLIRLIGIDRSVARELADSDILLQAWLRWDEGCLDRIVGDFAFAIFSTADRKLTLVRDPVGERPLFFAECPTGVAFASMPRGLLALPGVASGLDLDALSEVAVGIRPPATSYFNGITKVEPGECVSFTAHGRSSRMYWDPSLQPLQLREDQYTEAYRDVLRTSVESRLRRTSGLVCSELSSGFDSSAIAATAARIEPGKDVVALTAAPREGFSTGAPRLRFPDESAIAGLTASMNRLRHVIVRPSGAGLARMREMVRANQDPFYNYVNLGWIGDMGETARECGAIASLTGEYGNLTLHAGGIRILGDLIARGRWKAWLREARLTSRNPHVRWRGILMNSFEARLPASITTSLNRWAGGVQRRSDSVFVQSERLKDSDSLEARYLGHSTGDSYLDRLQMLRTSDVGQLRKGYLSLFGVEQRAPLGDRRAVEFSLRLPREQLLHEGEFRPLARRALRDRLPAEVLDATSRGYQGADWFEQFDVGQIRSMVEEVAANGTASDLLDIGKMHRALDHWPAGFEGFDVYQRLALDLPMALGTGLFILEAEKWLAGKLD